MENFIDDIICYICENLKDYEKMYFFSTCKDIHKNRLNILFTDIIHIKRIRQLPYFNKFTNVIASNKVAYPYNIVKLTIFVNNPIKSIPKTITNLTLCGNFDKYLTELLPNSITHLTFGHRFNRPIAGMIPLSVTHLTFGMNFNQPIQNCIPDHVTHLTFGIDFNQPIDNCIPRCVIHLIFGMHFNQYIYI